MSTYGVHKPWYRDRWPWLLMLPPGASVVAGFTLLYFAVHSPAPLVVDDYARIEEISHEEQMADERATVRRLEATLHLRSGERGTTEVAIEIAGDVGTPPQSLALRLQHAGNAAADRALMLEYDGREYVGRTDLAPGRYDFELRPSDGAWRLAGAVGRAPTTVRVTAAPQ
jgi:uncharacterized protein